ncbi:MAG: glycosyltransferase [Methylophaga sp.]|nr:glycosyltransferase [Methylophaga sp.]
MSDSLPNVGVLLAAYNGVDFLDEQLESILKQKNVNITIFISVDLSSDNSYEWCCNYAEHYAQIRVLPYGERFGGAAPNFFRLIKDVDFSSFDYIALADQDDIWLEEKLITACTYIKKDDLAAYSSNVLAFWPDGREQLINKAQLQRQYDFLFEAAGPGCSYVFSSKQLLEFKEFLIQHADKIKQVALHDWLIYAFYRSKGFRWFIDPEYQLLYRQHDANQVGVNTGWSAIAKRLNLLRNGWYKKQVMLTSELVGYGHLQLGSRWAVLKVIHHSRRRWQDRIALFIFVLFWLY